MLVLIKLILTVFQILALDDLFMCCVVAGVTTTKKSFVILLCMINELQRASMELMAIKYH